MIHTKQDAERRHDVEAEVKRQLSNDTQYAYYFRDIDYEFDDGVLTLHGRLPTFYLKQILQARLTGIQGIVRVENRVDVVSATGLSSIGRHLPND